MANYDALKATINANIHTNGNEEITGAVMNQVLIQMVNDIGGDVANMSGEFYGIYETDGQLPGGITDPGYAYVGATSPFSVYFFDGTTWEDTGAEMDVMTGPSISPFKGFYNTLADLEAAVPSPLAGEYAYVNIGGTPPAAHIYYADSGTWTDSGVDAAGDQEAAFSTYAKAQLLFALSRVAWIDGQGQSYIQDLRDALILDLEVVAMTIVFDTGGEVITDNNTLDDLRPYLTVTVDYNDGTSEVVTTYLLSGSMTAGTQTITVDYMGYTDTFTVTVQTNYAEEIDNWMYHKGSSSSVAQYNSAMQYIVLKCATTTDLNNYAVYVADVKKTLWSAVNGKTVKVRIKTDNTTDGQFGLGIYQSASITTLSNSNAKRAGLNSLTLAADGYYEQTFICDFANFTIGSLSPGGSATFGVWCYSRSTSNYAHIYDVQIFEVTP